MTRFLTTAALFLMGSQVSFAQTPTEGEGYGPVIFRCVKEAGESSEAFIIRDTQRSSAGKDGTYLVRFNTADEAKRLKLEKCTMEIPNAWTRVMKCADRTINIIDGKSELAYTVRIKNLKGDWLFELPCVTK